MENTTIPLLSVSDFIALTNQALEYAYPVVMIEGEVSSFKLNQAKYIFFDLKDESGSVGCFMMAWQLRQPIEDGMKVVVEAVPKLTAKGKFSLTVQSIKPSGEGSLRRSFEMLKGKLEAEGLFSPERKRAIPEIPSSIAVISSTEAAGYADFIKIVNDRWGGLKIDVAHVQVQGDSAPDQIIRALKYFNERDDLPEVVVIVRGGGSVDDLSAFNDELLVRAIASSRVPVLVGVGHETDITLADLVADVRAATPSHAAQMIVPDRVAIIGRIKHRISDTMPLVIRGIEARQADINSGLADAIEVIWRQHERAQENLRRKNQVLAELDPSRVLSRGYAIIRGDISPGRTINIEMSDKIAVAEVKDVKRK